MRNLFFVLAFGLLSTFAFADNVNVIVFADNTSSAMEVSKILNQVTESLFLDSDVDFRSVNCSRSINGVEVSTHVNCFLCGEERTLAKCEAKLTRLLNQLTVYVDLN